jgi:hypothetical protein
MDAEAYVEDMIGFADIFSEADDAVGGALPRTFLGTITYPSDVYQQPVLFSCRSLLTSNACYWSAMLRMDYGAAFKAWACDRHRSFDSELDVRAASTQNSAPSLPRVRCP